MANEISITTKLTATKGSLSVTKGSVTPNQSTLSAAPPHYSADAQSIPTTAAGTLLGMSASIGTAGWAYFRNLDTTNYVQLGVHDASNNFIAFAKLKAGEAAVIRLATKNIYALANTAAVILEWTVLDD